MFDIGSTVLKLWMIYLYIWSLFWTAHLFFNDDVRSRDKASFLILIPDLPPVFVVRVCPAQYQELPCKKPHPLITTPTQLFVCGPFSRDISGNPPGELGLAVYLCIAMSSFVESEETIQTTHSV